MSGKGDAGFMVQLLGLLGLQGFNQWCSPQIVAHKPVLSRYLIHGWMLTRQRVLDTFHRCASTLTPGQT